MNQSLTHRLFISASVVLCLFLGITGFVLDNAFSISLESIVREKLRSHTYALLSMADNEKGVIVLPEKLPEERFNTQEKSLIAIVTDTQQNESWRSISASNRLFTLPAPNEGQWLFGRAEDSAGDAYYLSSYSTIWPDNKGKKTTFVFTVMESVSYYRNELSRYRFTMIFALFIAGLILLILQAIIFRWGLKPVRGLAKDVKAMNQGNRQTLTGNYPKELLPLTSNLNLLINNERRQRERYRDRMADLSHSLKTPLSVLRGITSDINESGQPVSREQILATLNRQVSRMDDIVDYQLQRAVTSKQRTSFVATPIAGEVNSVIAALDKVYADKNITCKVEIDQNLSFYGDENDLIEILGNLLDNAYKHCRHAVRISAKTQPKDNTNVLSIHIEDDGNGIKKQQRTEILKRGVRLDSTRAGQGFGLAIVVDIISSYKGTITVGDSSLGGALFTLTIPDRKKD